MTSLSHTHKRSINPLPFPRIFSERTPSSSSFLKKNILGLPAVDIFIFSSSYILQIHLIFRRRLAAQPKMFSQQIPNSVLAHKPKRPNFPYPPINQDSFLKPFSVVFFHFSRLFSSFVGYFFELVRYIIGTPITFSAWRKWSVIGTGGVKVVVVKGGVGRGGEIGM
ncbi:hypothetical protein GGR52DRAFT_136266 [Hypoxylon sp. FL1284]|nr:hypothetical protein GGR52DRAFT_136266 [Hypoxylon sp. FL1284]